MPPSPPPVSMIVFAPRVVLIFSGCPDGDLSEEELGARSTLNRQTHTQSLQTHTLKNNEFFFPFEMNRNHPPALLAESDDEEFRFCITVIACSKNTFIITLFFCFVLFLPFKNHIHTHTRTYDRVEESFFFFFVFRK